MTEYICVLSDIHGQIRLLEEELDRVYHHNYELVILGDLFDRASPGGDSQVLDLIQRIQKNPGDFGFSKVTILRGNHEDMLVRAIEQGPNSSAYELWEFNGGDPSFYKEAGEHLEWLKSLPLYYIKGDYLFVHAGVMPGVPLEDQHHSDLVWIREPFLDEEDHELPYYVVHGHTPVDEVEVHPNRLAIDTGSFFSGNLSTVLLPV